VSVSTHTNLSESTMSVASFEPDGEAHNHKRDDDLERDLCANKNLVVDDQKQLENASKPSPSKSSMTSCNPYLSKSVMNLASSPSPYLSPSLSRSGSNCSIASSSVSSGQVTAMEIRTLTNNFQKLLKQATKEIKKLNLEKTKLEQEQEKLLTTNVELAVETKQLLLNQKEREKDKQELINANEELATEVEKLYKAEEQQLEEKENMLKEIKSLQQKIEVEKKQLYLKHQEEKNNLEIQIEKLEKTLQSIIEENKNLKAEQKSVNHNTQNLEEDMRAMYEHKIIKLETTIDCLQSDITQEKEAREEGEVQILKLSNELEKAEQELKSLNNQFKETQIAMDKRNKESITKLKEQNENLTAENFEYAVENNDLKKKVNEQLEREKKLRKEIGQLKVENQWLINNQKNSTGSSNKLEVKEEEFESLANQLKEEKEKVKNLTTWKAQLTEKNKELKEDNHRLLTRAEDLERLMNDEVTDINEILTVINTIQEDKKVPELKSKRFL